MSARDRAVVTFYAQANAPAGAVGVCRGLSCELNGAPQLENGLRGRYPVSRIHCLGYCDRAPALLRPDGEVVVGAAARGWPKETASAEVTIRPDIRVLSARAIVTERIRHGRFDDFGTARRHGVYQGLTRALSLGASAILATVEASGERGRGGAGYPTAHKWQACAVAAGTRRFVVANGDEGDPGSYIDRILLEDDPHAIIEGLAICALAVGAAEGIVFIRGEYPRAQARMRQAILEAREAGVLGASVMGSPIRFDIRVVSGRGSYVCGEETALLNAIEGGRAEARLRPPFPSTAGLHGQPTVVNNIETLVNIPWILREGAQAYRAFGTSGAPGTKAFCLARGFARPGIVEAEFGLSLRELVECHGGGGSGGAPLAAVAIGGPMGSVIPADRWDVALEPAELARRGIRMGHGGLVPIAAAADLHHVALNWLEFMAGESCGKCAPCALGSRRALDLGRQVAGGSSEATVQAAALRALLKTIGATSLCGFGQGIVGPILALLDMLSPGHDVTATD